MKKTIIYGLIAVILGYIIGNIIFTNRKLIEINNDKDKYYLLQEGVYYENDLNNNQSNINPKIVEKEGKKISIYVGITKNLEVVERLINIYEEKNIKLSIVEKKYSSEELKNNIEQFDFLILSAKDKDEILKIEEVVLASYDEIINNSL